MPDPLATVEELAAYLGREIDEEDPSAILALNIASDLIRNFCGHSITQVEDDEIILDGTGTQLLLLPATPVTEVASVEVDGEELEEDDYAWSRRGWIVRTDGYYWPTDPSSIAVTYTHGYETVPDSVKGVALALAGRVVDGSSGIKQESIGSYSVTYADPSPTLRANEQAGLEPFRVV